VTDGADRGCLYRDVVTGKEERRAQPAVVAGANEKLLPAAAMRPRELPSTGRRGGDLVDADYDSPPRVHPTASESAQGTRQHSFQDAIAANEVVIERRAHMTQNEKDQEPTCPAMECE
jgi:hypothetical protein